MSSGAMSSNNQLSNKSCFAPALGLIIAAVVLPAATNTAFAAGKTYRTQRSYDRDDMAGLYDYAGGPPYVRGGLYGPGFGTPYVFVPGHGILGAPCGLPTSACPNSARPAD